MRRILILAFVVVALLVLTVPAYADPPTTPNPNALTEFAPGHYINRGFDHGNASGVKVYESEPRNHGAARPQPINPL